MPMSFALLELHCLRRHILGCIRYLGIIFRFSIVVG